MELPPCVNRALLSVWTSKGRPCPRVELDADNAEPLELFRLLIREDARGMAPLYVETAWGEMPPHRRLLLLRRTLRALSDEEVSAVLYPKAEE